MIIQPSGVVSFVEADIFSMSYREMSLLIGTEGLDAVHFSEPLNQITKNCGFKGYQLAMYPDRDGFVENGLTREIIVVLFPFVPAARTGVMRLQTCHLSVEVSSIKSNFSQQTHTAL